MVPAEDPYGEIEEEMNRLSVNCSSVLMLGNFNSRTRNLSDYIMPDHVVFDNTNQSEIFEELQAELSYFENNDRFMLHRQNSDAGVNNYGYRMVDFCKNNNMYIVNGRGGANSSLATCKNISTVDYFLASANLFQMLHDLSVHKFSSLFSDSHNPVSLSIKLDFTKDVYVANYSEHEETKLWNAEMSDIFINNFNTEDIMDLSDRLEGLKSKSNISQGDLNSLVDSLNGMYISNSRTSFGTFVRSDTNRTNKPLRWFNRKCKIARNKFHNAKFRYKIKKTDDNKQNLNKCSKSYKKILKTEENAFKNSKIKQMRAIKTSNPRQFWKFLNENKTPEINLSLRAAHEYFSKINYSTEVNASDGSLNLPNAIPVVENEEINVPISLDEISHAVNMLKNNKSSGLDMILNEHIKYSFEVPYMHDVYVNLFNLVFDTGIIPEAWYVGKIIPIYKQKGDKSDPSNYRPITLLSCMGKLFTSVINNRLQSFAEKYETISECQAGFRKRFSTTDHIFALHTLVNLLQCSKKKLFCSFIDLKGAFDSV